MTETSPPVAWAASAPLDRKRLIRERAKAGLLQREVAERSGISKAHVSRLERGACGASATTLHRLARAIGCRVEDLMTAERAP